MDAKTLDILEFQKVLDRLAGYTAFSASTEKARALLPTSDRETAKRLQAETSEARRLLEISPGISVGGARDVREAAWAATRGILLEPSALLDIKYTLIAGRTLGRHFEGQEAQYPCLSEIAAQLPPQLGLVDVISKALSERGEILDTASEKLGQIRNELRIAHDRLLSRLEGMVNDPKITPYLQEAFVTQRDGRYVIPLRAEYKNRVKSIVHDQSSSGATLFVEPLAIVDMNNRYRELQLAERDEERRILADLSDKVGKHAEEIDRAVETLAELDLIFARAKYAEKVDATEPELKDLRTSRVLPHPGVTLRLWQARHPLLDPDTVVPVDVELDSQTFALVITGPNTGGKTVTLKTVGLLTLMAQSGLQLPVQDGSELSVFDSVYADIGDEQSIEQSLSTFSAHITNIIRILKHTNSRSLVLLDELGAGTDPQEGAALARAILNNLVSRGVPSLVATHFPELKAYAHTTPGVSNASVEFDLETLRPTYRLTIGLPGRSNALAIASRLGLSDEIIEEARSNIHPDDLRADDLLDEIHRQREAARTARVAAEQANAEARRLRHELVERLEHIEDERREILETAREEAKAEINALQAEIQKVRNQLAWARQPLEALKPVQEQIEVLEQTVEEPVERHPQDVLPIQPVRLGSKVKLHRLNAEGVVISLSEDEAEVQVGVLRVCAPLHDLEALGEPPNDARGEDRRAAHVKSTFTGTSPGMELDLRGQRVDDALEALDRYLDAVFLARLSLVRIIHGSGMGRLREAVRQMLSQHPHVKSFEPGGKDEGGNGVTIVRL
ncbi:MAG: endonuclease MutS2 [Chloroflexota bacterium]